MRHIEAMMMGLLIAGCGMTGQTIAAPTVQARDTAAAGSRAGKAPRSLPVARAGSVLLIGEGWLSSAQNDYNLSIDASGQRMVFARSAANFKEARIWTARREGQGWSEPQQVSFSDSRYKDSDPWLTPDGRMLYFVSNRPVSGDAPNGSLDIWRVAVGAKDFGVPEHLATLASPADELGPELHGGWLYFNSSRKDGPAQLSIYRAPVEGLGFGAPQALPTPFNDGRLQGDFTLSPDGRIAMFWRQPRDSKALDLYASCRTSSGWSAAVRMPEPINSAKMSFTPAFSADGNSLYFSSLRGGEGDAAGSTELLNGQSNLYVWPVALVREALPAECDG